MPLAIEFKIISHLFLLGKRNAFEQSNKLYCLIILQYVFIAYKVSSTNTKFPVSSGFFVQNKHTTNVRPNCIYVCVSKYYAIATDKFVHVLALPCQMFIVTNRKCRLPDIIDCLSSLSICWRYYSSHWKCLRHGWRSGRVDVWRYIVNGVPTRWRLFEPGGRFVPNFGRTFGIQQTSSNCGPSSQTQSSLQQTFDWWWARWCRSIPSVRNGQGRWLPGFMVRRSRSQTIL